MTEPVFDQNSVTTREFARMFAELERRITDLERGAHTPQLGYSSIDNGELLVKHLDDVKLRLGRQSDGTYALKYLNGDPPPAPSDPVAAAHQLGVVVYWDGTFAGGVPRPEDVQRVDLHISDEGPDFEHDGTTVVGSLLGEGALHTGFSDMTQKYVKLVAVSYSGVASPASGVATAFPLPAGVIGAGVVAAENLVGEVILGTQRIIAGDPLAARAEMNNQGFQAYSPEGELSFAVESDTGNALVTGEYRTALNGPRITVGEQGDYQMMRFYRGDETEYSEIVGYTTEERGRSAIWMRGSSTRPDQGGSIFFTNEDESTIQWFTPDNLYSRVRAARNFTDVQSGFIDFVCDRRRNDEAGDLGARVGFTTLGFSAGERMDSSILYYRIEENTDRPAFFSTPGPPGEPGSSIRFGTTGIHIADLSHFPIGPGGAGYVDLFANNAIFGGDLTAVRLFGELQGTSGREAKKNIQDIPFSAVDAIKCARSFMWEYDDEVKRGDGGDQHIGPMAEDLPEQVLRENPRMPGIPHVDLASMVGLLWDAVGKIADRLDAIEQRQGQHSSQDI